VFPIADPRSVVPFPYQEALMACATFYQSSIQTYILCDDTELKSTSEPSVNGHTHPDHEWVYNIGTNFTPELSLYRKWFRP